MRSLLIICVPALLLSSCARLFNAPKQTICLRTDGPVTVVSGGDTLKTRNNQVLMHPRRKNEPLHITLVTDSITKTIRIPAQNSFMYWSNIFTSCGIGMLFDRDSPKRYGYPARLYVQTTDTATRYQRYQALHRKGDLLLHLSIPYINNFELQPQDEPYKSNTGFWGLSAGLDWFHSDSRFWSVQASAMTDFFVPLPGAVDISGEYELMSSAGITVTHNHRVKRFSLGYGLAFARNNWDLRYYDRFGAPPPSRTPVKKSHSALGLAFPLYYKWREHFNLGLVYRPTFYQTGPGGGFLYEHVISLELAWKLKLK